MDQSRLFGYARVSTADQDLSLQRQALIAYGVPEDAIFEEHASGGTMNRRQLSYLLRAAHPGDTVVVWKLDRFGRTLKGIIETVEWLVKEQVNLVSITEKIDTASAMGRVFFHIIAAFAQLERDLISERTKAGMKAARAKGIEFGAKRAIADNPKRLDAIRPYFEDGRVERGELTAQEALVILNRADPKARPVRAAHTWYRWLKAGCPGLDG